MYFGPTSTQILNFMAINLGAVLSSLLMPLLIRKIGEGTTVNFVGMSASLLFILFLLIYHLEELFGPNRLQQWQIVVAITFMFMRGISVCDLGIWKTITMDHTPTYHRGKWNGIDTVISGLTNVFVMCCGVLSEWTGIMMLFYIAGVIKLLLALNNIPL